MGQGPQVRAILLQQMGTVGRAGLGALPLEEAPSALPRLQLLLWLAFISGHLWSPSLNWALDPQPRLLGYGWAMAVSSLCTSHTQTRDTFLSQSLLARVANDHIPNGHSGIQSIFSPPPLPLLHPAIHKSPSIIWHDCGQDW